MPNPRQSPTLARLVHASKRPCSRNHRRTFDPTAPTDRPAAARRPPRNDAAACVVLASGLPAFAQHATAREARVPPRYSFAACRVPNNSQRKCGGEACRIRSPSQRRTGRRSRRSISSADVGRRPPGRNGHASPPGQRGGLACPSLVARGNGRLPTFGVAAAKVAPASLPPRNLRPARPGGRRHPCRQAPASPRRVGRRFTWLRRGTLGAASMPLLARRCLARSSGIHAARSSQRRPLRSHAPSLPHTSPQLEQQPAANTRRYAKRLRREAASERPAPGTGAVPTQPQRNQLTRRTKSTDTPTSGRQTRYC